MKKLLFVLCLLIVLIFRGHTQNQIIVGQTIGNHIHYINYDPDSTIELFSGGEGFLLDIDKNSINDLEFIVNAEYTPNWYSKFWSSIKTINNKVKILSERGNYNLVRNLNAGDTISANLNWNAEYDSTYELIVNTSVSL